MANQYINLYMNNPTEGGTDGSVISTDGYYTSPLTVVLDAAQNESKKEKLAIRTQSGFKTEGETTISDVGDVDDRWKFSLTEDGEYADTITIADEINTVNTIFWAQVMSSSLEAPHSDRSVSINVTTIITGV